MSRKRNYDFFYQEWLRYYNSGPLLKSVEACRRLIDYLEERGNTSKLLHFLGELSEKRFLPDELEDFKMRVLLLQGDSKSIRKISNNHEAELKILESLRKRFRKLDICNRRGEILFLRHCQIFLTSFGPRREITEFVLNYINLVPSSPLLESILQNKEIIKNLGSSVLDLLKEQSKELAKRETRDNTVSEERFARDGRRTLPKQASPLGPVKMAQWVNIEEEQRWREGITTNIDLNDDRVTSDMSVMCLMAGLFDSGFFFAGKIKCRILGRYLQAAIMLEKGEYDNCIKFVDDFFRQNNLTKKEQMSMVRLQARAYKMLGNEKEFLLKYELIRNTGF